jgi:hypothetical protein
MTKDVVARTENGVQAMLIVRPVQTALAVSIVIQEGSVGFVLNQ